MARIDYERVAADYDGARELSHIGLAAWRHVLAKYLQPREPGPLLDLGCGTGQWSLAFAEWFDLEVIAADPSPSMLAQARAKHADPRIRYVAGDADHLPCDRSSVRAAWLSTVIHHVPSLDACARELARVLLPDGTVLIRSFFPGGDVTLFRFFPAAARVARTFPSIPETTRAFERAGFDFVARARVAQESAGSLREFLAAVKLRADTTLRAIDDVDFEAGLAALERAVEHEHDPTPVVDTLDLLVLRSSR